MSEMPDMNNAESDAATGLAARASYAIHRRLEAPAPAHDRIQLDHLQREKGRLRVRSEAGAEVRVFLERGRTLQVGEVLASDCGRLFEVSPGQPPCEARGGRVLAAHHAGPRAARHARTARPRHA